MEGFPKFGCEILVYKQKKHAGTATKRTELAKIKTALKWAAVAQNRILRQVLFRKFRDLAI